MFATIEGSDSINRSCFEPAASFARGVIILPMMTVHGAGRAPGALVLEAHASSHPPAIVLPTGIDVPGLEMAKVDEPGP